jgi:hypothetical protein
VGRVDVCIAFALLLTAMTAAILIVLRTVF